MSQIEYVGEQAAITPEQIASLESRLDFACQVALGEARLGQDTLGSTVKERLV